MFPLSSFFPPITSPYLYIFKWRRDLGVSKLMHPCAANRAHFPSTGQVSVKEEFYDSVWALGTKPFSLRVSEQLLVSRPADVSQTWKDLCGVQGLHCKIPLLFLSGIRCSCCFPQVILKWVCNKQRWGREGRPRHQRWFHSSYLVLWNLWGHWGFISWAKGPCYKKRKLFVTWVEGRSKILCLGLLCMANLVLFLFYPLWSLPASQEATCCCF